MKEGGGLRMTDCLMLQMRAKHKKRAKKERLKRHSMIDIKFVSFFIILISLLC